MDPKMDSGYLEPGETMEDDYDFSQALLPEEIIGIIDQLIYHEVCYFNPRRRQGADVVDGMAHGTSIVTDNFHQLVH